MTCSLDSFALLNLQQARQFLDLSATDLTGTAFSIYLSLLNGTSAGTVAVTSTGITLIVTGGAGAGTNTLLFSTYTTVGALQTAVQALNVGWVMELVNAAENTPTTDLLEKDTTACWGASNITTIQYYNNCLIHDLINYASAKIERLTNRNFAARSTTRRYISDRSGIVRMKDYPVQYIDWVSVGRKEAFRVSNTDTTNLGAAHVNVTHDPAPSSTQEGFAGMMRFQRYPVGGPSEATIAFTEATSTLKVVYDAINVLGNGWVATTSLANRYLYWPATILPTQGAQPALNRPVTIEMPGDPVDHRVLSAESGIIDVGYGGVEVFIRAYCGYTTIPYDIQLVALEYLKKVYHTQQSGDPELQSETLGDYSYTRSNLAAQLLTDRSVDSGLISALAPYVSDDWSQSFDSLSASPRCAGWW